MEIQEFSASIPDPVYPGPVPFPWTAEGARQRIGKASCPPEEVGSGKPCMRRIESSRDSPLFSETFSISTRNAPGGAGCPAPGAGMYPIGQSRGDRRLLCTPRIDACANRSGRLPQYRRMREQLKKDRSNSGSKSLNQRASGDDPCKFPVIRDGDGADVLFKHQIDHMGDACRLLEGD